MPTISGIRRRGVTPDALKKFIEAAGVARRDGINDIAILEHAIREDLNKKANRVFGILNPLKLIITNWEEGKEEMMEGVNNPEDESAGKRSMPFTRELYIDQADFLEKPAKPSQMVPSRSRPRVRLKYGYIIKCTGFKKGENGEIEEVYAEYDPDTRSGQDTSGKKVKGTLGWVSADHAVKSEIRLYDRLFKTEDMSSIDDDFKNHLNEDSLTVVKDAILEPSVANLQVGDTVQFERIGYFRVDEDSADGTLAFNRVVTLRDNWAKKA